MAPALAARRASDVLRHLARHPDQQLTLSELAAALEVAPAALHGVVTALTESGDQCARGLIEPVFGRISVRHLLGLVEDQLQANQLGLSFSAI